MEFSHIPLAYKRNKVKERKKKKKKVREKRKTKQAMIHSNGLRLDRLVCILEDARLIEAHENAPQSERKTDPKVFKAVEKEN